MSPDNSILSFLSAIGNNSAEPTKKFGDIDNTLNDIYKLQQKDSKEEESFRRQEARARKRLAQIEKRKKADGRTILQKIFGKKKDQKKAAFKLNKWMLKLLAVGGAGAGIYFFRDKIAETLKKMKEGIEGWLEEKLPVIKEKVDEKVEEIKKELGKKAEEARVWLVNHIETGIAAAMNGVKNIAGNMASGVLDFISKPFVDAEKERQGGEGFYESRRKNNEKLEAAGLNKSGKKTIESGSRQNQNDPSRSDLTDEQKKAYEEWKKEEERLNKLKKEMDKELRELQQENRVSGSANRNVNKNTADEQKEIKKRFNDKALKKQTGGPILVPGAGDGDKVPMLLPPGSFVLNKKASQEYGGMMSGKITKRKKAQKVEKKAIQHSMEHNQRYDNTVEPQGPMGLGIINRLVPVPLQGDTTGRKEKKGRVETGLADGLQRLASSHDKTRKLLEKSSKGFKASISGPNVLMPQLKGEHLSKKPHPHPDPGGKVGKRESGMLSRQDGGLNPQTVSTTMQTGGLIEPREKQSPMLIPFEPSKMMSGGMVSGGRDSYSERLSSAHNNYLTSKGMRAKPQVITVKRLPPKVIVKHAGGSPIPQGGGSETSVNIVEMRKQLHRLNNGAYM
jgi:hypothetical protein